jgi:protein-S-isoprenylcysteine O-methyltransferase Ste14
MLRSHILFTLAWLAYCALHSILAGTALKHYFRIRVPHLFTYYRIFYNILALGWLLFLIIWQIRMPSPDIWHSVFLQYIPAAIMTIAGISGMGICLKKYFVSSQGFRDLFFEGGKPVLVQEGLHRVVRHPLYLSTFIFLWGVLLFIPTWSVLIVNTIITIYTLIGIRFEEYKLVQIFGEQYVQYREKVPKILPRIIW